MNSPRPAKVKESTEPSKAGEPKDPARKTIAIEVQLSEAIEAKFIGQDTLVKLILTAVIYSPNKNNVIPSCNGANKLLEPDGVWV